MTPTRAQNRVRREYGIGKGKLHKRMVRLRDRLYTFCFEAAWRKVVDSETKQRAHDMIDEVAAASVITAAYREAEKELEEEEGNGE